MAACRDHRRRRHAGAGGLRSARPPRRRRPPPPRLRPPRLPRRAAPRHRGPVSAAPASRPRRPADDTGGTIYVLDAGRAVRPGRPAARLHRRGHGVLLGHDLPVAHGVHALAGRRPRAPSSPPDLATDLGTATDGGKTWAFTLRDGVTFQDGSPITCADIAYGVSRTFATDVINQGPTYAIAYLDIPYDADGTSAYKGPYKGTAAQQALFDKAVTCSADGKTITFHLNKPVADFNYTVTLGFSPVPKAADTGETYGVAKPPVASGPYMVESYTTGNGGKMVLVRNPKWSQASDPYRTAVPGQVGSRLRHRPQGHRPAGHGRARAMTRPRSSTARSSPRTSP